VPARILAPAIGLDAPIIAVKVDASGAMGTPRTAGEVGWYGPRPGDPGNALFAGHVDWLVAGQPVKGSFYLLSKLKAGDLVSIRAADGQTRSFRVEWNRYYQANKAPVDEITGPTDHSSITLITCGGQFDRSLRSYVGRWIVRASLLEGQ
jgi:sortase (surface protein transpeptidase)